MSVYTDFVRQLEPGGPGPPAELFDLLWEGLRGTLAVEMKRRSVWQTRPSFLGVLGHTRWVEPGVGSDGLDELTGDCFEFVFVRRLEGLRRQAERKPTVDGLVLLAVRHFLLEAQKTNDPLGFRVFEILRDVVLAVVAAERLWVIAGSPKIRNETRLAHHPEVDPEVALGTDLSELVERWSEERLADLVEATHRALGRLIDDLGEELVAFLGPERPAFRFGDLAAPLKQQVRWGWAARFSGLSGFVASMEVDEPEDPDSPSTTEIEERQRLGLLVRCIERSPERRELDERARRYLDLLWGYLKGLADVEVPAMLEEVANDPSPEGPISQRRLAEHLGIPRARLPGLFDLLRRRWQDCQRLLDSKAGIEAGADFGPVDPGSLAMSPSDPHSPDTSPRERARASLARRLGAGSTRGPARPEEAPTNRQLWAVGDLFVVPAAEVEGMEWSVVRVGLDGDLLRCAPVDTCTLLGQDDLDLTLSDPDAEPRIVRFAQALDLSPSQLDGAERLGRLGENARAAVEGHDPAAGSEESEPTELAAYRDWIDEGPGRARRALEAHLERRRVAEPTHRRDPGQTDTPTKSDTRPPRRGIAAPWLQLVAAALLVAVVGLGWKVGELGRLVDQLSHPIVGLPYREIQLTPEVRGPWELQLPPHATHVQLGLILVGQPDYPSYRLDITRPDGELIHRQEPLPPSREIDITLPRHLLGHELFEVRLYGVRDGEAILLETETAVVGSTTDSAR